MILIGSTYLDNLNLKPYIDIYYQLPFRRVKKRTKDELNKNIIKYKKRKIIYTKDNEQVRDKT